MLGHMCALEFKVHLVQVEFGYFTTCIVTLTLRT